MILLAPPNERGSLNEIAAQIRAIMLPEYAHTRPGLRFPNVLGGRDTFSPIRASCWAGSAKALSGRQGNSQQADDRPEVADVRASLSFANPELQVKIDRQLASDLGVRVSDVASAVRLMMSGDDEISTFKDEGEQYPVTMRLMEGQRDSQEVLSRLLVPSARLG